LSIKKFFKNFCVFSLRFEPTVFGGAAGGPLRQSVSEARGAAQNANSDEAKPPAAAERGADAMRN